MSQTLSRPYVAPDVQHAWHLYVIQLDLSSCASAAMSSSPFSSRRTSAPASILFPYICIHTTATPSTIAQRTFPNASAVFERIISLPIYPKMAEADVQRVIDAVRKIAAQKRR